MHVMENIIDVMVYVIDTMENVMDVMENIIDAMEIILFVNYPKGRVDSGKHLCTVAVTYTYIITYGMYNFIVFLN